MQPFKSIPLFITEFGLVLPWDQPLVMFTHWVASVGETTSPSKRGKSEETWFQDIQCIPVTPSRKNKTGNHR